MKNFKAQVVVRIKSTIKDIKGLTLKQAAENLLDIKDLSCRVGSFYELEFKAKDLEEAELQVSKIARGILSNDVVETYDIVKLEEVNL